MSPFQRRPQRLREDGAPVFLNRVGSPSATVTWTDSSAPRLWQYNLHYFDWLMQTEEAASTEARAATIARWTASQSMGRGVGWEPYPLSLRIVNWIKWALAGQPLDDRSLASLATQCRFLAGSLEYHLLGNHLLANAKALYFAGCFFGGGEGDAVRRKGFRLLERELKEQILADGAHFELSTAYHLTLLEDVLDVVNMAVAFGDPAAGGWSEIAGRMLAWAGALERDDGRLPLFNDAAHEVAPPLHELRHYAAALGINAPQSLGQGLTFLPSSGYFAWRGEGLSLFGDVGAIGPDYLPGHAHADTLAFDVMAGDTPVIIDGGVSTYDEGPRRNYERGTASHNTVQVANHNQSEMWAAFRVGRRARVVELEVSDNAVSAAHTGYDWIGVRHGRRFSFEPKAITVNDRLTGRIRSGVARFHLAPGIDCRLSGHTARIGPLSVSFSGGVVSVKPYQAADGFNQLAAAVCLEVAFDDNLETRITSP